MLLRDSIRRAAALFRRRPITSIVIVSTVALGIATTLTAASVAVALFLEPLSFARPGEVVAMHGRSMKGTETRGYFAPADFADLKRRSTSFAALAAHNSYE